MRFTDVFLRRPVLAIVVSVLIIVAGAQAVGTLNVRQYPRLESATVTVVPRLLARRGGEATPLGAEYWGDTTLDVPAELGGRVVNVLTGETLEGDALPLHSPAGMSTLPV